MKKIDGSLSSEEIVLLQSMIGRNLISYKTDPTHGIICIRINDEVYSFTNYVEVGMDIFD